MKSFTIFRQYPQASDDRLKFNELLVYSYVVFCSKHQPPYPSQIARELDLPVNTTQRVLGKLAQKSLLATKKFKSHILYYPIAIPDCLKDSKGKVNRFPAHKFEKLTRKESIVYSSLIGRSYIYSFRDLSQRMGIAPKTAKEIYDKLRFKRFIAASPAIGRVIYYDCLVPAPDPIQFDHHLDGRREIHLRPLVKSARQRCKLCEIAKELHDKLFVLACKRAKSTKLTAGADYGGILQSIFTKMAAQREVA